MVVVSSSCWWSNALMAFHGWFLTCSTYLSVSILWSIPLPVSGSIKISRINHRSYENWLINRWRLYVVVFLISLRFQPCSAFFYKCTINFIPLHKSMNEKLIVQCLHIVMDVVLSNLLNEWQLPPPQSKQKQFSDSYILIFCIIVWWCPI